MEGAQQCCLLCRWYVGSQLALVTVYKIRILLCNSKSQQRAGPLWGLQDLVILAYHCFYENCFAGCSKNSSVGVSVMTWPGFHSRTDMLHVIWSSFSVSLAGAHVVDKTSWEGRFFIGLAVRRCFWKYSWAYIQIWKAGNWYMSQSV